MLSTPRNEFPEFPAALSFLFGLTSEEALTALERRSTLLREKVARLDRELAAESAPRACFCSRPSICAPPLRPSLAG